jgi:hypothetical protein
MLSDWSISLQRSSNLEHLSEIRQKFRRICSCTFCLGSGWSLSVMWEGIRDNCGKRRWQRDPPGRNVPFLEEEGTSKVEIQVAHRIASRSRSRATNSRKIHCHENREQRIQTKPSEAESKAKAFGWIPPETRSRKLSEKSQFQNQSRYANWIDISIINRKEIKKIIKKIS